MKIYLHNGKVLDKVYKIIFGSENTLIVEFEDYEKDDELIFNTDVKEIKVTS